MSINKTDMLNFAADAFSNARAAQTARTNASQIADAGTTAPVKKEVDRDAFLNLLVAQLKNQDPLAPQDGAQFVAQLAQFNSLDQLININKGITQLLDQTKK